MFEKNTLHYKVMACCTINGDIFLIKDLTDYSVKQDKLIEVLDYDLYIGRSTSYYYDDGSDIKKGDIFVINNLEIEWYNTSFEGSMYYEEGWEYNINLFSINKIFQPF